MDHQTIENLSTVGKLLVPLFTAAVVRLGRTFLDRNEKRKLAARAELEFISGFLAFDIKRRDRLVVEHAFAAHFKHKFDFEELVALLKFKNPTRAFSLLKSSRLVMQILPNGSFGFCDKFSTTSSREHRKWIFGACYFIAFYFGLLPVLFANSFISALGLLAVYPLVLWPICLALLAIESLKYAIAFGCGERLIVEQQKLI